MAPPSGPSGPPGLPDLPESPELHPSARKHFRRDRLDDAAVKYAAVHVLGSWPLDEGEDPRRWLSVGVDPAGRALELVTLVYDDGSEVVIHAMKARQQYLEGL